MTWKSLLEANILHNRGVGRCNLDLISCIQEFFPVFSLSTFPSDGSNYVRSSMFDRSKSKIGCLSSIANK